MLIKNFYRENFITGIHPKKASVIFDPTRTPLKELGVSKLFVL